MILGCVVWLGMFWVWGEYGYFRSQACQSVCVLELSCEGNRDKGNTPGESCEASVSLGNGEVQLCGLYQVQGLLQKQTVVVCRNPELCSWAESLVGCDAGTCYPTLLCELDSAVSSREIACIVPKEKGKWKMYVETAGWKGRIVMLKDLPGLAWTGRC